MATRDQLIRWQRDPVAFVADVLIDPETDAPFTLYPAEIIFLQRALTLTPAGTLPYPELVFSAPKKSGKTALAAMIGLYLIVVHGGRFGEGYCLANDLEQSTGRVFQAMARIVEASPLLCASARVLANRLELSSGATIQAIASDYAGAAGANPTISIFDELWAYTSERSYRLWDEMIPPPTRQIGCRLTVTYAGFEGESSLLEGLYKKAMTGKVVGPDLYEAAGLLAYWSHEARAPWQTDAWRAQMREQLRPMAYRRMIENRFVSGEETFIPVDWWDRAATGTPIPTDKARSVVLGVDAGLKRDSAAVVACACDRTGGPVQLIAHRVFTPRAGQTLDLESTLEETVRDFARRFTVREVRFDPWQFQRSAQGLTKEGLPMVEFPQSLPNLTAMSTNLYELLKGGNLLAYPDDGLRLAMQRAVAVETPRGLKITKEKAAHKIDVVVALAMAALGAVQGQREPAILSVYREMYEATHPTPPTGPQVASLGNTFTDRPPSADSPIAAVADDIRRGRREQS